MFLPNPPHNSKLNPIQYFSGSLNKICSSISPEQRGSVTENQLLFLSNIASQALIYKWEDVMELSASLYRLLEQKNISWEDGPALQRWWTRALDGMKSKAAARTGDRAPPQPGQPRKDDPSKAKTNVAGLPIVWMRDNKICIKFQTGACQETGDHTTTNGSVTLKHLCGGCRKLNKSDDTSHGAKTCPFKSQFFQ